MPTHKRMTKLPAFQFYPGDWLKDPELRSCSPAARAAWIDFLCYLFLGPTRYSFLQAQFSAAIRCAAKLLHVRTEVVQELIDKRVCKQSKRRGILFSARLLRDERERRRAKRRQRLSRARHAAVTPKSRPSSSSSSTSVKSKNYVLTLPPNPPFDTPAFAEAWADWEQSRREARKPLKPTTIRLQFRKLQEMGHDRAVAALRYSAANGYTGIFEEASRERPGKTARPPRAGVD